MRLQRSAEHHRLSKLQPNRPISPSRSRSRQVRTRFRKSLRFLLCKKKERPITTHLPPSLLPPPSSISPDDELGLDFSIPSSSTSCTTSLPCGTYAFFAATLHVWHQDRIRRSGGRSGGREGGRGGGEGQFQFLSGAARSLPFLPSFFNLLGKRKNIPAASHTTKPRR